MNEPICIFCFRAKNDPIPWVLDNPGNGCQYGLAHEYLVEEKSKQQSKKPSKSLCIKCNLHPNNPASKTNECLHEYPKEIK